MKKSLRERSYGAGLLCLVCVAVLVLGIAGPWLGDSIQGALAKLCHQRPDRSHFLAGKPLLLCARCTGFWLGTATACVLYYLKTQHRPCVRLLIGLAIAVAGGSVVMKVAGIETSNGIRTLLGVGLGMTFVALAAWVFAKVRSFGWAVAAVWRSIGQRAHQLQSPGHD